MGKLSNNLRSVSCSDDVKYNPIKQENFIKWEKNHNYKTNYTSMYANEQKIVNSHIVPNTKIFIPKIKSENIFGRNYTKCANFALGKFDEIRYLGKDHDNYKE